MPDSGRMVTALRGSPVRDLGLGLPPSGAPACGPRPPGMPLQRWGRPLKRWRYVGAYGPELMVCAGEVFIGPLRQRFWAVAERGRPLLERTSLGSAGLTIDGPRVRVASNELTLDIFVEESEGVESVAPSGRRGYAWTRKQAGVPARGAVRVHGAEHRIDCEAVIDDSAGYHARHTSWRWSAGVGRSSGGERVGWNLVAGINDPPAGSERSIWVDGTAHEAPPVRFDEDLSGLTFAGGEQLRFSAWAARENRTNLLLLRSDYRQPFGTFEGELPGGLTLAEGYGVMEHHDVYW